ncbi:uncharacterized protein PITG_03722 [Phytophthora infestans T30-4]|uniref:Uncharacterized protein n=1 Tax=Phytophthora infestans (strain T30-4) TaxID=403677 RepID=D0MYC3_PHYIT|nr:uncharacterized protein PITG_03722 [Phytophthora infestans T30-4]EEY66170.1 hypothetical protein PITG_03722 [Phytophthora infestans T30-4]|eukprot:XP_002906769.1 hypothetical protein PITG_03722 [Phytophthora infestans T30-4]
MVTGRPSMARKMPSKSLFWNVHRASRASCCAGESSSTAPIMRRTAAIRCAELKNMCSVRVRPIPCAPCARASRASSGVSAFVNTSMRRCASTHFMNCSSSPLITAFCSSCLP